MAKKELSLDDRILNIMKTQGSVTIAEIENETGFSLGENVKVRMQQLESEGIIKQRRAKGRDDYYSKHPEFIPYQFNYGSLKEDFSNMWKKVKGVFGYST